MLRVLHKPDITIFVDMSFFGVPTLSLKFRYVSEVSDGDSGGLTHSKADVQRFPTNPPKLIGPIVN